MREEAKVRIATRKQLWKEQNQTCIYCKRKIPLEKASLDHIVPVDLLNDNLGESNLVVTCKYCNRNKGNLVVFYNAYDGEYYPMVDVPVIFKDYYIHKTTKIRRSY